MFFRKKDFTATDANELFRKYEAKLEKNYDRLIQSIEGQIKYGAKRGEKRIVYKISDEKEYPTGYQSRLEEYFSKRGFTISWNILNYVACVIISW